MTETIVHVHTACRAIKPRHICHDTNPNTSRPRSKTCYYGTRDGYRSRKEKKVFIQFCACVSFGGVPSTASASPVDARRSRRQHAIHQLRRRWLFTEQSLQNRRTSRVSVLSLGLEAFGHLRLHLRPPEQIRENDVRGVDPDQLFSPTIRYRAVWLLHTVLREGH